MGQGMLVCYCAIKLFSIGIIFCSFSNLGNYLSKDFFFGMLFWFETQKRFVLHWSWMMIILQIYNNDWLEIVVYTERTGTIEIEFVAKKILIFFKFFLYSNFFFSSYFFIVFWGWTLFFSNLMARLKLITKKNWAGNFFFWKIWNFFFYLGKVFFFLVTTFKFGLFSSFL